MSDILILPYHACPVISKAPQQTAPARPVRHASEGMRQGRSVPQPRTVKWHLHKVSAKLGISPADSSLIGGRSLCARVRVVSRATADASMPSEIQSVRRPSRRRESRQAGTRKAEGLAGLDTLALSLRAR
jgi:hypothetical protein